MKHRVHLQHGLRDCPIPCQPQPPRKPQRLNGKPHEAGGDALQLALKDLVRIGEGMTKYPGRPIAPLSPDSASGIRHKAGSAQ